MPRPGSRPGLAIVTPGFPRDAADSTCVPALQLYVRGLVAARPDLDVTVFSLHYPERAAAYRWEGIPVRSLGANNVPWPGRLGPMSRLARALSTASVDLLHGFWLSDASWCATMVGMRRRLPVLVTLMGQDALPSNPYHRVFPLSRAQGVVPSPRMRAEVQRVHPVSIDVVPWGVEAVPPTEKGWGVRATDLLGVGALTELKDWETFLRIAAAGIRNGLVRQVQLIGEGPAQPSLQRRLEELGISEQCRLLGRRPRAEVLESMGDARVLLHPSRYEGFGMVFQEALAMGMAVVSRPVGAAMEGPRWWVGASDEALAQGVSRLLAEPPGVGPTPHRVEDTVEGYLDIYRRLGASV